MADIVAAALTSDAPLITGKPEVSTPEQRDRLYAGFRDLARRFAAARPDLIIMFVNDGLTDEDLAGYELNEAERTALKAGDITSLYHLGANPYLIRRVFRQRFPI
jgi:hypothetical protein